MRHPQALNAHRDARLNRIHRGIGGGESRKEDMVGSKRVGRGEPEQERTGDGFKEETNVRQHSSIRYREGQPWYTARCCSEGRGKNHRTTYLPYRT